VTFKLNKPSPALVVATIALFVSLGPVVKAANTVFSTDIVDGEVKTADLADESVTSAKLAPNSVRSANVVNNSLTTADIKGADVNPAFINLAAGAVAIGRCVDLTIVAAGTAVGEGVLLTLLAAAPAGMLFTAVRVPLANRVTLKACNLTGGASPAISSLPVRVITFG
jgi:hypothetical protein